MLAILPFDSSFCHVAQTGGGDVKQGTTDGQVPPKPATTMPVETVGVGLTPCNLTAHEYTK
jgi:hypothetical protein